MNGKLIVIEGLDGSGKATQAALLARSLESEVAALKTISFPRYEKESSALVRGYLEGRFGTKPGDVNCYAASSFYAADRYISYKTEWGADYNAGAVFICDRYTTSNAVYQTSKLPESEWQGYLDWLYDFEYEKLGLPRPDAVIYLDMPPECSAKLMEKRYGGDESRKDIHERDIDFQVACRRAAAYCALHGGWKTVCCADGGRALGKDEIHNIILNLVRGTLDL